MFLSDIPQLATHSTLMFGNSCLGELAFEGTSSAIMMSGIFISFLVEYGGNRFLLWQTKKRRAVLGATEADAEAMTVGGGNTIVNITVLEAGIIFHSLGKSGRPATISASATRISKLTLAS